MDYVDLQRNFVALSKDAEPKLDTGRSWGRHYGGWLDWANLIEHQRVVLLAEAASGKSEEFKHAAASLREKGSPAFYATIESLVDARFPSDLTSRSLFERWKARSETAWFFLDSVDEARLNRKRFEDALDRLSESLGPALSRARVLVSCRASDWKGTSDRATVLDKLPVSKVAPVPPQPIDADAALLDPIFSEKNSSKPDEEATDKPDLPDLLVVQLMPLTGDQRRALAVASGVTDPDTFLQAIELQGLDVLAERPGDIIELAQYWGERHQFGTLSQMTSDAILAKLKETDHYRPDNAELTPLEARQGAERLAGALTLTKSFTLIAPGGEPDPELSAGAIDPGLLLDQWTTAKANALLRRGLFAPSTYGRLRFHHRSTQEYLAGKWIARLLEEGCEKSEVADLLFVECYGVRTVVPSLRATAAWLALDRPEFRAEIIEREPLLLMTHGDPSALPIDTKAELLLHLARRHASGDVADDSVDRRSMWMFASTELAGAIHEAWAINSRAEFRADLIRLIREGRITGCIDLAAMLASDKTAYDYHRVAAVEALVSCNAVKELRALAKTTLKTARTMNPRIAPGFARLLFPKYISLDELLRLIAESLPPLDHAIEGFGYAIEELWAACPDSDQTRFLDGIATLCLQQPLVDNFHRVSKRHLELAKRVGDIAHSVMTRLGEVAPPPPLVKLLAVVERAERTFQLHKQEPPLHALVQKSSAVQRALFWHDVEEVRAALDVAKDKLIYIGAVYFGGTPLWSLSKNDLPWLEKDLSSCRKEDDRRLVFNAICNLHENLKGATKHLRKLASGDSTLVGDLKAYLSPPKTDAAARRYLKRSVTMDLKQKAQEEKNKASWLTFREKLLAEPSALKKILPLNKSPAFNWLLNLTTWLTRKTGKDHAAAALEWRLLEPAFSREVAENYRDAMMLLWREVEPEAPVRDAAGVSTVKWTTILCYAATGIEAAADQNFANRLRTDEAVRAALHGCLSGQGDPAWLDALIDRHPAAVVPIVADTFRAEWLAGPNNVVHLLYRFAKAPAALHPELTNQLFAIVTGSEPTSLSILDRGLSILHGLRLSDSQRRALGKLASQRFKTHAGSQPEWATRYLALLFSIDARNGASTLIKWLRGSSRMKRKERALIAFSLLFGRNQALAGPSLDRAPVQTLEQLVVLAYQEFNPENDIVHVGVYSMSSRDDAESGRNVILTALIDAVGPEAYAAMIRLSNRSDMKSHRIRFRELARRMAERDSEFLPWKPAEVLTFERERVLAVKSAAQLYSVARRVLQQIPWDFQNEDASSRPTLKTAKDENAVQHYLAEQLRLRAKGRFHIPREAEVAEANKPDIILMGTSNSFQVAIEAKHGGKNWSTATLEHALREQLAEDYLRPANRRNGILVVTNHRKRGWKHPVTRASLSFADMIDYLNGVATAIKRNSVGDVSVCVVGIDALPRVRRRSAKARPSGAPRQGRRKA